MLLAPKNKLCIASQNRTISNSHRLRTFDTTHGGMIRTFHQQNVLRSQANCTRQTSALHGILKTFQIWCHSASLLIFHLLPSQYELNVQIFQSNYNSSDKRPHYCTLREKRKGPGWYVKKTPKILIPYSKTPSHNQNYPSLWMPRTYLSQRILACHIWSLIDYNETRTQVLVLVQERVAVAPSINPLCYF